MIRVSTIIPAYNAERFIVRSVESALNQSGVSGEIIVVNDGSTDNTRKVLAPLMSKILYLEQEHNGVSTARNLAIQHARGEFLNLLDADDIAPDNRLQLMLACFAERDVDIVFGHMRQFRDESPGLLSDPIPGVLPGGSMFRKSTFLRVGPFDPNIKLAEYLDWLLRARELGLKECVIPEVLLYRRVHETNMGKVQHSERGNYASILKASLDRKRARIPTPPLPVP